MLKHVWKLVAFIMVSHIFLNWKIMSCIQSQTSPSLNPFMDHYVDGRHGLYNENNANPPASDTTIILLSSLIPTHPSIKMINDTFNSIELIDGLPSNTKIIIGVDGLPAKKNNPENIKRIQEYLRRLRLRFADHPYVTILNNYEHGHLSGSLNVAIELVKTEYIYVIQHDYKFIKQVNHKGLITNMRERPDEVQIVRFGERDMRPINSIEGCNNYIEGNGIYGHIYFVVNKWSDINHFTTKAYYEKLLAIIGSTPRFPEYAMMTRSKEEQKSDCGFYSQWMYNWKEGPYVKHLDGKGTLPDSIGEIMV